MPDAWRPRVEVATHCGAAAEPNDWRIWPVVPVWPPKVMAPVEFTPKRLALVEDAMVKIGVIAPAIPVTESLDEGEVVPMPKPVEVSRIPSVSLMPKRSGAALAVRMMLVDAVPKSSTALLGVDIPSVLITPEGNCVP